MTAGDDHRRQTRNELLFLGGVFMLNMGQNRLTPRRLGPLLNPLEAASFSLGAYLAGASWRDQGLEPSTLGSGLRGGAVASVPLLVTAVAGSLFAPTRALYLAAGGDRVTASQAAYQAFVRIPLGTAVSEELIFRAAGLGLFSRGRSPLRSALLSSFVFGLWHVLPAMEQMTASAGAHGPEGRMGNIGRVGAVIAFTTVAGFALCWLRLASGSVLAPTLVHAAVNSSAYLASWRLTRRCLRPDHDERLHIREVRT